MDLRKEWLLGRVAATQGMEADKFTGKVDLTSDQTMQPLLGDAEVVAKQIDIAEHWLHRLVRCEVDFTHEQILFHALRRREPGEQPLLTEIDSARPSKPFKGSP